MSHYQKLYNSIKNNPKNVSFDDLDKLMQKYGGFDVRQPASGSSHYTYSHPDLEEIITVKREKPHVKPCYIKKALKALEKVRGDFE